MRIGFAALAFVTSVGCTSGLGLGSTEGEGSGSAGGSDVGPPRGSPALAIDAEALYWTFDGAVQRYDRGNGAVQELAAAAPDGTHAVAVNASVVAWVDAASGIAVRSCSRTGGQSREVAYGGGGPIGIALTEQTVVFSAVLDDPSNAFVLSEFDLESGASRPIVDTPALGVQLVGDNVFGTTCEAEGVWRVPLSGGQRTALVADAVCPTSLIVDEDFVYFADTPDGMASRQILRVPVDGGAAEPIASTDGNEFVVRNGQLFSEFDGGVWRTPASGGTPEGLGNSEEFLGIAVDAGIVYWLERNEEGALSVRSSGYGP